MSLPRTSALRCSKCEGYGHETHQCLNWNASFQEGRMNIEKITEAKSIKARAKGEAITKRKKKEKET